MQLATKLLVSLLPLPNTHRYTCPSHHNCLENGKTLQTNYNSNKHVRFTGNRKIQVAKETPKRKKKPEDWLREEDKQL